MGWVASRRNPPQAMAATIGRDKVHGSQLIGLVGYSGEMPTTILFQIDRGRGVSHGVAASPLTQSRHPRLVQASVVAVAGIGENPGSPSPQCARATGPTKHEQASAKVLQPWSHEYGDTLAIDPSGHGPA